MILLTPLADAIKLSAPILLIAVGIAIGFIPGMPVLEINPEIIFLLFLPPLLYDAAFNTSFESFKAHFRTISSLAFGLVFISTAGIAVAARFLIPGMNWKLAFVLGAILAATDAVAAMSITKNMKLSRNTKIVLEGESLINDASALVAYRFAVAAVTGVAFIWWEASITFLILLLGGFAIGLVMGFITGHLVRLIRNDTIAVQALMVLAPFVTYLLAEEWHCSGVIAVVVLGIGLSRLSAERFPRKLKQESKAVWDLIVFLLNGFVFILLGLEFPIVVRTIDAHLLFPYAGFGIVITIIAVLLRTVRVFMKRKSLQLAYKSPHLKGTRREISRSMLLSAQESLIISWAGMRGIVSLAVALALPTTLENGEPFPMRAELIYISTVVILFTIIGQGLLLPLIVRKTQRDE